MRAHNMPFDTHEFVKKAKAVGFTEQQAEFQAQELSHVLWDGIDAKLDNLVTKDEFRQEFQLLRKDNQMLEIKINSVDSKLTWLVSLFGLASVMLSVISLLRGFHVF